MHHDKLEEFCIQEKNLLLNLVMLFQKSTVCLLKNETDTQNGENINVNIDTYLEEKKAINEIKKFDFDDDLQNDLNNILLQSKVVFKNAINQDQYQDLMEDDKN